MKYQIQLKFLGILLLGLFSISNLHAKDKEPSSRQKVIDFEGDVVEGVNKRPLDSLSELSEVQKRRKKMHLYRKRKGFRTETQETLREMRYVQ